MFDLQKVETAYTFDDVLLKPAKSDVLPAEVDVNSVFSRNIGLKIPLVSAAMDTVTEWRMAIAMAELGGLGIIHKNLSTDEQARQVRRVKRLLNLSGMVEDPVCITPDMTIGQLRDMTKERRLKFHSFPVVSSLEERNLVGILTGHDLSFCFDNDHLVGDKMSSSNLRTIHYGSDASQAFAEILRCRVKVLPVLDSSGKVVGLYTLKDLSSKQEGDNHVENYNVDKDGRLIVGAAIGVGDQDFERAEALVENGVDVLVVDSAHGFSKNVTSMTARVKDKFGDRVDVVAGNVATTAGAYALVDAGADGVKVGIGPGSICTTRTVSGVGVPQMTAVANCVHGVATTNVPICSDGGIKQSGDIPKAIGAGASSVMIGSMLAGTDEAPGNEKEVDGRKFKEYRGMGSLAAMRDHAGSRDRYGHTKSKKLVAEGVESLVPYTGSLEQVVGQLLGGLRAGMGYTGSPNILSLKTGVSFNLITNAGLRESHVHDVKMISKQ